MPYIGRGIETLSDRVVLDSLTASATASYTLQLNSVNFVPSSASSLTVSLNGVIQKPDSSYTVSGSTLTFSSALTSSDSIDFIIAERDITLQTPSAGSVGTTQLANSAVDLTSKVTGTLPVANGGTGVTTSAALANTGNLVLLSSQTASNDTTINFDNTLITDTYNTYKLIGREIVHGTDDTASELKLSIDNGSNFLDAKTNRMFNHSDHSNNTVGSRHGTSNTLTAGYPVGTASGENGNIEIDLLNLRSSLNKHILFLYSYTSSSGTAVLTVGNKEVYNTSQVNYIQYRTNSGNVASGKFSLYGVKT